MIDINNINIGNQGKRCSQIRKGLSSFELNKVAAK